MTREEAIKRLSVWLEWKIFGEKDREAINMAISALQAEPEFVHIETYRDLYEKYIELKHKSSEPSDLISRADAMSKCKNAENELTDEAERKGLRVARFIIGELPSATSAIKETETKEHDDLISRTDAIKAIHKKCDKEGLLGRYDIQWTLESLPSADRPTPNNITESPNDADENDDEVIERPIIEHDKEWIIGCIKHDGFIHTDRFDKANQIILDALADRPSGEWEHDESYKQEVIFCSKCGVPFRLWDKNEIWHYCPNCGARMENTK